MPGPRGPLSVDDPFEIARDVNVLTDSWFILEKTAG